MANFLLGGVQGHHQSRRHFKVVYEDLEHEITEQNQPLSLQHYSEYRSTYKWHEFAANTSASLPAASTVTASANNEVVVKKPPKPISGEKFPSSFPNEFYLFHFLRGHPLRFFFVRARSAVFSIQKVKSFLSARVYYIQSRRNLTPKRKSLSVLS